MSKLGNKILSLSSIMLSNVGTDKNLIAQFGNQSLVLPVFGTDIVELPNQNISFKNIKDKVIRGTSYSYVMNAVHGLLHGHKTNILIKGTGYRISQEGDSLRLDIGYSNPKYITIPANVNVAIKDKNNIEISSIDKQALGDMCDRLINLRPVNPYKGFGAMKATQKIILKQIRKKA
jgi:large subunit ribosomal protein L6